MKGLAAAGHNVTVASSFSPANPIPNYRFVKNEISEMHTEMMKRFTEGDSDLWTMVKMIPFLFSFIEHENRNLLKNEEFQRIMQTEQFDLVVYEGGMGELLLGLSIHFDCPTVLVSSLKPQTLLLKLYGNPISLSYVSNILFGFFEPMDFISRLVNFMYHLLEIIMMSFIDNNTIRFYDEHFPAPKYPPFLEVRKNVSAVFIADHISQKSIRPLLPSIIQIGGIQINNEESRYLHDDLQKWMDESTNGLIYFSLGSNMKITDLKQDILKDIFNVLRSLKENILMKLDDTSIEGLPPNIRIGKWLPQVGILAHKNCKLFISHAGLGSLTEARYFGIPLITIPIFGDQMANSRVAVREHLAVEIKFSNLNGITLSRALTKILGDPKYRNAAKYQSMLYLDRPQTALETGIFWIEYIIRHKGAHHMRSNSVHLNFLQLHSLDVVMFLVVIVLLVLYFNWRILKWMVNRIISRNKIKTN